MTRVEFTARLVRTAAAVAVVAALLWIGAGSRWFGFYGVAALAVLAVLMLAMPLWRRLAAQGHPRWPAVIILFLAVLAALAQIGYWAAFFSMGDRGIGLGVMRTVILEAAGPYLPWAAGLFAIAVAWLLARASGPDLVPKR